MSKLKILTIAMVPALGLALVASAQQPDPKPGQKPEPTPRAGPGDVTKTRMPGKLMIHRGDDVLGQDVVNPQGENLGGIKDLVIQPNGQIAYAVLSFGGFLGLGDKLFAIPWGCLDMHHEGMPATAGREGERHRDGQLAARHEGKFVLAIDKEKLKNAPGFDDDNWPNTGNVAWCGEIEKYYAGERRARPIEASAPRANTSGFVLRASDLKGREVRNDANAKIGDIQELAIDPMAGRVNFAVVDLDGLGHLAVPWDAFEVVRDGENEVFRLKTAKEKLTTAPRFERDSWDRATTDPAWVVRVYEFFSIRPYWSTTATGTEMEKKEGKEKKY
ncbi:MAG TPA: PRC-barrel domain-containing protein [Planctomycetota bacterium]|nr:PRC-barrel domain-containing protein [Planctomycetota bacterium]